MGTSAEWHEAFDDLIEELVQEGNANDGVVSLYKRDHMFIDGKFEAVDFRAELRFQMGGSAEECEERRFVARGGSEEEFTGHDKLAMSVYEVLTRYLTQGWSPTAREAAAVFGS